MSFTKKSLQPHLKPVPQKVAPCCDPIPFIQTTNLSLSYKEQSAFENISLTVHRGCLTAVVGPSGSGKTSFLMCLNRLVDLVPECQISGHIQLENLDLLSPTIDLLQLRRRVGMIFQKPNPFPMSIHKNLAFPLKEHGETNHTIIQERIQKSLMDVGLWNEVKDRLEVSALSLSGGQQQRLCIARALVLSPDVLLMDEPCSALDPISSGIVEDLIFSLRGQYTVVIVTHNLAQARRIADYVGIFWNQRHTGELIEFGPTQQIFENPQHELTTAYINGVRG
ncbi:MAG: phosphate ABC transporter ATP-binding protein [Nitrospirales bacterium]